MTLLSFARRDCRFGAVARFASARRWFARTLLALVLPMAAVTAGAEKGDRDKPINFSADSSDVNYQTKIGTLVGNVIVTQGTMTIHADKIIIRQNPDNSMSVTAYGNPVSFRQKRDGVDEYFDGFAQRAEYDGTRELLELFDRALLRRGADEIRSNYISYNGSTELFKAEGRVASPSTPAEGSPGSRVRGVFQPKSEASPAKDAPKAGTKDTSKGPPVALQPAADIAPAAAK